MWEASIYILAPFASPSVGQRVFWVVFTNEVPSR